MQPRRLGPLVARTVSHAGVLAFGLVGLACHEAPSEPEPDAESTILYKPKPDEGSQATLDFLEAMSNGASPDYVSDEQPASGSIRRNKIAVSGPYALTIQFSPADLATCEDGGARLAGLLGMHDGAVDISVDRRALAGDPTLGVVVNFETTVGGSDYFLTTGRGMNVLSVDGEAATVRKTAGFIRIVEDGDLGVWCPARSVFDGTNGVVDFEFVFTE